MFSLSYSLFSFASADLSEEELAVSPQLKELILAKQNERTEWAIVHVVITMLPHAMD